MHTVQVSNNAILFSDRNGYICRDETQPCFACARHVQPCAWGLSWSGVVMLKANFWYRGPSDVSQSWNKSCLGECFILFGVYVYVCCVCASVCVCVCVHLCVCCVSGFVCI